MTPLDTHHRQTDRQTDRHTHTHRAVGTMSTHCHGSQSRKEKGRVTATVPGPMSTPISIHLPASGHGMACAPHTTLYSHTQRFS
ncbi:hypothetical protein ACRRTK_023724 [Alexandromys fortis]